MLVLSSEHMAPYFLNTSTYLRCLCSLSFTHIICCFSVYLRASLNHSRILLKTHQQLFTFVNYKEVHFNNLEIAFAVLNIILLGNSISIIGLINV